MLSLIGHLFSSYTWKAQIALHALGVDYELAILDEDHPENGVFLARHGGPWGKFPLLDDDGTVILESTSIIEWLDLHHATDAPLIPKDPDEALRTRMLDRIFDNYVMAPMQAVVDEFLRSPEQPDAPRIAESSEKLLQSYGWLENWRATYAPVEGTITLIECAAAPALFYADWVQQIPPQCPLLREWRAHLLALPEVARCVEQARPYRSYFPLGAPDRD
jgi:glutathione S-transferase